MNYKLKENYVETITKSMFAIEKKVIHGFYRKTLTNMKNFWLKIDRVKLL